MTNETMLEAYRLSNLIDNLENTKERYIYFISILIKNDSDNWDVVLNGFGSSVTLSKQFGQLHESMLDIIKNSLKDIEAKLKEVKENFIKL